MIEPRVANVPPRSSDSAGDDAIDLAAAVGINLDDWQQHALRLSLGETAEGKWAAPEVGLLCARQNGKSELLIARALAELFLFGPQDTNADVMFSAHEFKTGRQIFRRTCNIIEASPSLKRLMPAKGIRTGAGTESVELLNGMRLLFVARSKGSGRGFSPQLILLDEAQDLTQDEMDAMMPSVSAKKNPQIWYTGTVPGPLMPADVWTRVRDRGRSGEDSRLAWIEWSAGEDLGDLDDQSRWRAANPAWDTRMNADAVALERVSLAEDSFARERLSIWPSGSNAGIFGSAWDTCLQPSSTITGPVTLGVAVSVDRAFAAICAAGRNADGRVHLEVVEYRRGTSWLVDRAAEVARNHNAFVVIDGRGPASSFIASLESLGVRVTTAASNDVVTAAADIYDLVQNEAVAHLGHPDLDSAVLGARKRDVGDRWAFGRKTSTFDLSPLEAAALAAWGVSYGSASYDLMDSIAF